MRMCKCSQHGNCLLSDSILIYIFTKSGRVNLAFYTVNCSYWSQPKRSNFGASAHSKHSQTTIIKGWSEERYKEKKSSRPIAADGTVYLKLLCIF